MRFLLDVNALVALGVVEHQFHSRTTAWVRTLRLQPESALLTCSITELGFVRVLSGAKSYGFTVATAVALLRRVKTEDERLFEFITDDRGASGLPSWVAHPKQVTDGHLMRLAAVKNAALATLDTRIPGAFVISE